MIDYESFLADHADEEILVMEEHRSALLGFAMRCGHQYVAVYDRDLLLESLAKGFEDDEDPELAAEEWIEYNIEGAWVGEGTPWILERLA